jgi:mRNA interferase HigB
MRRLLLRSVPTVCTMQTMLVVNAQAIEKFLRKNRDVATWMEASTAAVNEAEWDSLQDIRIDYPSADGIPTKAGIIVTVFNVKGNTYRLLTWISYKRQMVQILDVLTHAEYSKGKWKG